MLNIIWQLFTFYLLHIRYKLANSSQNSWVVRSVRSIIYYFLKRLRLTQLFSILKWLTDSLSHSVQRNLTDDWQEGQVVGWETTYDFDVYLLSLFIIKLRWYFCDNLLCYYLLFHTTCSVQLTVGNAILPFEIWNNDYRLYYFFLM